MKSDKNQLEIFDEELLNTYAIAFGNNELLPSYNEAGVNFYHINSRFAKNFRNINGLRSVYNLGKSHKNETI